MQIYIYISKVCNVVSSPQNEDIYDKEVYDSAYSIIGLIQFWAPSNHWLKSFVVLLPPPFLSTSTPLSPESFKIPLSSECQGGFLLQPASFVYPWSWLSDAGELCHNYREQKNRQKLQSILVSFSWNYLPFINSISKTGLTATQLDPPNGLRWGRTNLC